MFDIKMNSDLQINLVGIPEERWTEREERCADCRKFFDDMREDAICVDEDDGNSVPLLLWRKAGKEMLRLCWPCARKRMSASDVQSGSE